MGKKDDTKHRVRYTLAFKLEAVRLVKGGQDLGVTAKVLGMPKQTLGNWVRLSDSLTRAAAMRHRQPSLHLPACPLEIHRQ